MQILVTGFENSGVEVLRKIFSAHPHVAGSFNEKNLMNKYSNIKEVDEFVSRKYHTTDQNWVEAIEYTESIDGTSPIEYCRRWNKCFGSTARTIHIIRHPLDIALTSMKQNKGGVLSEHLEIYKDSMRYIIPKISNMKNTLSIKYEDLLLKPDTMLPIIFEFCGIDPHIDFRAALLSKKSPKFINSLDTSGVFVHEYKKNLKTHVNLNSVYQVINKIVGGEAYH